MDDDDKKRWIKTKRIEVWLTADDLEALNFICYKYGGASKSRMIRTLILMAKHFIDTGNLPGVQP